jgi:hypothetical protein
MSDDIVSKYKIPLLNGENHKDWSVKMKLVLEIKHLWKYADPDTADTAAPSSSSKKDSLEKVSALEERAECRALLLLAMDDLRREVLQILPTPVEIWAKAADVYGGARAADLVACISELFGLHMTDSVPMEDYLAKFEVLNRRLAVHGAALPVVALTALMLARLSNYYRPVATTLEALATKDNPLNWDKSKALLLAQAGQRRAMDSDGEKSAMLAGRRRVVCSSCGGRHSVDNCWNLHPEKAPPDVRKRITKGASVAFVEPKEEVKDEDVQASGFAWAATSSVVSTRYKWWVDCGATNHMSPFKELFVKYRMYEHPVSIKMGDGRVVKSLGVGCIRIVKPNEVEGVLLDVEYVPRLKQNLFSSGMMASKGFKITAQYDHWHMRRPDNKQLECSATRLGNNLYLLDVSSMVPHLAGHRTVYRGRCKH